MIMSCWPSSLKTNCLGTKLKPLKANLQADQLKVLKETKLQTDHRKLSCRQKNPREIWFQALALSKTHSFLHGYTQLKSDECVFRNENKEEQGF